MQDYSFLLNIIAGLFLALAQTVYIVQVVRKKITPSLMTWLGWSLLVSIALWSQIIEYGWEWSLIGHLFSALGCTVIFIFSFLTKNYIILTKDWRFLFLGLGCIVLYLLYSDPWITTLFAILADAILGVPTIIKAINQPHTEKSFGWKIAIACWSLTLITCINNNLIFALFPAYCLAFNVCMSLLTRNKRILKKQ